MGCHVPGPFNSHRNRHHLQAERATVTGRKKTTTTSDGTKKTRKTSAKGASDASDGAAVKKSKATRATTRTGAAKKASGATRKTPAASAPASASESSGSGKSKATKKSKAATAKLPAAGAAATNGAGASSKPGKKSGKLPAKAAKPAASTAQGPAVDELQRRWKLVLNGPIRTVAGSDQVGGELIAFASADVPVGSRRPLVQPFADWVAEHDGDAAVQKLHDEYELSAADAPFVRARLEADFGAPAKFEEDREEDGTCVEANFVAVLQGPAGELISSTFRVTDHNAAAALRFEDPLPAETVLEAIADAFWRRVVESGLPLADFTDRTHLEAAGGQASFGVQNGQPFMDEDAMLSDETDVGDIVSRRLPSLRLDDGDDEADDETADDDDSTSATTPAVDDDFRSAEVTYADDDEPEDDEDEDEEDEDEDDDDDDDDGKRRRRRREDDDDYLRMMMSDDDDW